MTANKEAKHREDYIRSFAKIIKDEAKLLIGNRSLSDDENENTGGNHIINYSGFAYLLLFILNKRNACSFRLEWVQQQSE